MSKGNPVQHRSVSAPTTATTATASSTPIAAPATSTPGCSCLDWYSVCVRLQENTLTGSSERRYPDSTLRLWCDTELCYMNVTQMYNILVQASAVLPNTGRTVVKQN